MPRKIKVVVITGGPCAGKSTMMARAKQHFEDRGFQVVILSETATELITAGFSPFHNWRSKEGFQKLVLQYQLFREDLYVATLQVQDSEKPVLLLCDRGAMDGQAYVGEVAFRKLLKDAGQSPFSLRERYAAAVHLVTAADGAEKFYTCENNSARSEGLDQARELDVKTRVAWHGCQHLFIVDNSTDFNTKVQKAIARIARVLGMEKSGLEKEKKFLIKNWDRVGLLPSEPISVEIHQTYLKSRSGNERRVRRRVLDEVESFYYTEKGPETEPGVRTEEERSISKEEYEALLQNERDENCDTIVKVRHSLTYKNRHLEVDVYLEPQRIQGLVVVEAELLDMSEKVEFPTSWRVEEVTGKKQYSNRRLSERPR